MSTFSDDPDVQRGLDGLANDEAKALATAWNTDPDALGLGNAVRDDDIDVVVPTTTVDIDDPVPWAEPAHDPCPECGVCQDAHGEARRIFHTVTCRIGRDA